MDNFVGYKIQSEDKNHKAFKLEIKLQMRRSSDKKNGKD